MSDDDREEPKNWEEYVLSATGVSIDHILQVARESGLHKWTHNARSYELEGRLLETTLTREEMALIAAVCLSRMMPRAPEGTG